MRRHLLRLLALAAVVLVAWALPALPSAQAADETPVPVASPTPPAEQPAGSKGCYSAGNQCAAVTYRGMTFHVFSRTDNGYDAIVAGYDDRGRLQAVAFVPVGNRYFDAVTAVDPVARTFTVNGQSGQSAISFDVLDRIASTPLVTISLPARVGSLADAPLVIDVTAAGQPAEGSVAIEYRNANDTPIASGTASLENGRYTEQLAGNALPVGTYSIVARYQPGEGSPLSSAASTAAFEIFLQHRVTFVSGDTVWEVLVEDGQDAQAPTVLDRPGYTFTGWRGSFDDVTSDRTIFATYAANEYDVFLDAAGGVVDPSGLVVTYDAVYGPLPVPTRAGYDFEGWVLALEDGSMSTVAADTIVRTPFDHVLEAAWRLDTTVDTIVLTPSGTSVEQGGSVAFTAEGFNDAGLSVGDVTDDVTLVSDVATDAIDGATVTFPTASPHTITGTHVAGATDDVVIDVEAAAVTPAPSAPAPSAPTPSAPAPSAPASGAPVPGVSGGGRQLPTTGGEPLAAIAGLALLLMAGGVLTLRRRATR